MLPHLFSLVCVILINHANGNHAISVFTHHFCSCIHHWHLQCKMYHIYFKHPKTNNCDKKSIYRLFVSPGLQEIVQKGSEKSKYKIVWFLNRAENKTHLNSRQGSRI